jgi:hypothetical protein
MKKKLKGGATMELKIAKVNGSDLVIKPVLKDFYCRYCGSIAQCMSSPHRSGFWVVFEARLKDKRWLIVDGFGSSEVGSVINYLEKDWFKVFKGQSGACRYCSPRLNLYKHITCGGWSEYFPLPRIVELDEELEKQINELKQKDIYRIEPTDLTTIMRLLRANIIRKYRIFKDINVEEVEFYPEFADLLPLLKAYKRSRELTFSHNASITELPNSFTAIFKLRNIEFKIPKKRHYIEFEFRNRIQINLAKNLFIAYKYDEVQDKAIVYFVEKVNSCFSITGYEQYQNILHRSVSLSIHREKRFIEKVLDTFFDYRLGDVLFVPLDTAFFSEIIEYFMPARPEQFTKVTIENAELMNGILRPTNGCIEIFHPEHGLLELEPTTDYKCMTFTTSHD